MLGSFGGARMAVASPQTAPKDREASRELPASDASATNSEGDRLHPLRTVVVSEASDPQRQLDAQSPGFATGIDLKDPPGARPADALGEVLGRSVGASVRSLGGLGQFSALSLRGSTAQQVALFLDGVPLGGSGGVVNLGDLPLDSLGHISVYRGLVPVTLGGAAIGGAVDLASAMHCDPARRRYSSVLGLGSFGAREVRASTSQPLARRMCLDVRAGLAAATGDFPFLNLGNTLQDPRDDRYERRRNNHYERFLGQVAVHGRRGRWHYRGQQLVLLKRQGVPGIATGNQAEATSLDALHSRSLVRLRRDHRARPGHVELVGGFASEYSRYRDPLGEVSLALTDQSAHTLDVYVSPRVRTRLWTGADLIATVDVRHESNRVEQHQWTAPRGDAQRQRTSGGVGLQLDQFLADDRVHLQPTLRVDGLASQFAVPAGHGELDDRGRNHRDVGLSPRLGVRYTLGGGLSLRASGGRYFRPPTVLELFGDRGYTRGNEGLRAERGHNFDGGVVWAARGAHHQIHAHAAGFVTATTDLIQWQQAGPTVRAQNVDAAHVTGFETAANFAVLDGDIQFAANYTLLAAHNLSDAPSQRHQPLPGRPRHQTFVQVGLGHTWTIAATPVRPRLVYSVEHAARTFLDPSGRFEVPRRVLHGVGLELHIASRIHFGVEVRNFFNLRTTPWTPPTANTPAITVPIADFFFYPLPGASLWSNLRIDLDHPRKGTST